METQEINSQGDDFWREHIEKAGAFSGSSQEYCRINGLSKSRFYTYKQRLGLTRKHKSKRSQFVAVTAVGPVPKTIREAKCHHLPDPKWVAQVVLAIAGE